MGHISDKGAELGCEAVGEVVEIHPSVTNFQESDMVVYGGFLCGSYTEEKIIDQEKVIKIPLTSTIKMLQLFFIKLCTFLMTRTYMVKPKTIAFVTCAASGVSSVLIPLLKGQMLRLLE